MEHREICIDKQKTDNFFNRKYSPAIICNYDRLDETQIFVFPIFSKHLFCIIKLAKHFWRFSTKITPPIGQKVVWQKVLNEKADMYNIFVFLRQSSWNAETMSKGSKLADKTERFSDFKNINKSLNKFFFFRPLKNCSKKWWPKPFIDLIVVECGFFPETMSKGSKLVKIFGLHFYSGEPESTNGSLCLCVIQKSFGVNLSYAT